MKHNLTTNVTFKESYNVSKEIISRTHDSDSMETKDFNQLASSVHPLVSDYVYNRVKKELENERFSTLIKLSRVLDDELLVR